MTILPLDDIKSKFQTGDRPTGTDYSDLIDTLVADSTNLGTAGNNTVDITGIENETTIDSFIATEWRSIKYMISLAYAGEGQNKFYSTEFTILVDKEDININEYGTIDNDGDIGTVIVSKGVGVVSLIVTPNPDYKPITVRYYRTGLKA